MEALGSSPGRIQRVRRCHGKCLDAKIKMGGGTKAPVAVGIGSDTRKKFLLPKNVDAYIGIGDIGRSCKNRPLVVNLWNAMKRSEGSSIDTRRCDRRTYINRAIRRGRHGDRIGNR